MAGKPVKEPKVNGRPTKYRPEYDALAFKFCLLGATNARLAEYFEVDQSTIDLWIKDIPSFSGSVKKGRVEADAEIAQSLYHRGKGYSHPDVHISNFQGEITQTPITKHYPPDTAAAFIWLKNRSHWRDKQEVEHSGKLSLEQLVTQSLDEPSGK